MAKKTVAAKKRNVKVDANGQLHVHSSFNNIIVSLANSEGQIISWSSAGKMGFRGSKKNTPCTILQEKQRTATTFREQYELSFNAHLNLVTIHPWVDGNGRTARLLMNYIQFGYHLFPTKIFKEDREEYILSLRQCQDKETNQPFLDFMVGQLKKSLSLEIEHFNISRKRGGCFMF